MIAGGRDKKALGVGTRASLERGMLSGDGFVLFPELKVIFSKRLDLKRDLTNAGYDFLKENLEDGVWSSVLAAEVSRLLDKVLVLGVELVFL